MPAFAGLLKIETNERIAPIIIDGIVRAGNCQPMKAPAKHNERNITVLLTAPSSVMRCSRAKPAVRSKFRVNAGFPDLPKVFSAECLDMIYPSDDCSTINTIELRCNFGSINSNYPNQIIRRNFTTRILETINNILADQQIEEEMEEDLPPMDEEQVEIDEDILEAFELDEGHCDNRDELDEKEFPDLTGDGKVTQKDIF